MSIKIGIMGRWNATCGISQHVETLARNLIKQGIDVTVYAPTLDSALRDWHHKIIKAFDEPWVKRVYSETEEYYYPYGGIVRTEELEKDDIDVLIVETYNRFPLNEFAEAVHKLRRRFPLIAVVHNATIREVVPIVKRVKWDAIVVFDKRYRQELFGVFDDTLHSKIKEIPYPYLTPDLTSLTPERPPEASEEETLYISYGRQPLQEYADYIFALREMAEKKRFKYWIIRSNGPTPFREPWIIEWRQRPPLERIYSYVMGSDVHLLPKGESTGVVVSSTLAQILYSGTPTLVPDTRYFETIPVDHRSIGPVVKYRPGDVFDLIRKLSLLDDPEVRAQVSRMAREWALKHGEEKVSKMFLELAEKVALR